MYLCYCRPSAIPGPLPVEMVIPATESIGLFKSICRRVFWVEFCSYVILYDIIALADRHQIAAEDGMATWQIN